MKKVLSVILFVCVTVFAQELGLETDSGTVSSFEEELLLIGVDDLLIEDIVIAEDTVEESNAEVEISEIAIEDTASTIDLAIDSTSLETDTLLAQTESSTLDTTTAEEELVPVVDSIALAMAVAEVTAVSSVDVEGSLEGYKSPRRAMFFSLAVPGAGQAYVGKYWKTGLFVAIEAAAIVGAVHFKQEGTDIQNQAYGHYDAKFDKSKLETFLTKLTEYGNSQTLYEKTSEAEKIVAVDSVIFGGKTYSTNEDSTAVQRYIDAFSGDAHKFAKEETALQGWSDATPGYVAGSEKFYNLEGTATFGISENLLHLTGGDTRYGSSSDRNRYIDYLEESEKNFDISRALVIGILVNHVASATDAYITAHRHNRALMDEKNDVLSRISIDNQLYLSEHGELTTGVSLAWRF